MGAGALSAPRDPRNHTMGRQEVDYLAAGVGGGVRIVAELHAEDGVLSNSPASPASAARVTSRGSLLSGLRRPLLLGFRQRAQVLGPRLRRAVPALRVRAQLAALLDGAHAQAIDLPVG